MTISKRKRWLEAYGYKCAICGWTCEEIIPSHGVEAHHIIKAANGGSETDGNMIILCPNHHKMANAGAIQIEELKEYLIKNVDLAAEEYRFNSMLNNKCSDVIEKLIFGEQEAK